MKAFLSILPHIPVSKPQVQQFTGASAVHMDKVTAEPGVGDFFFFVIFGEDLAFWELQNICTEEKLGSL